MGAKVCANDVKAGEKVHGIQRLMKRGEGW